jgi:hypothetical protein
MPIDCQHTMHWWFPTDAADFAAYSPKLILLLNLACACVERRIQCLDLYKGDERNKRSFQPDACMLTSSSVDVRCEVGWLYQGRTGTCNPIRQSMALPLIIVVWRNAIRKCAQSRYCE